MERTFTRAGSYCRSRCLSARRRRWRRLLLLALSAVANYHVWAFLPPGSTVFLYSVKMWQCGGRGDRRSRWGFGTVPYCKNCAVQNGRVRRGETADKAPAGSVSALLIGRKYTYPPREKNGATSGWNSTQPRRITLCSVLCSCGCLWCVVAALICYSRHRPPIVAGWRWHQRFTPQNAGMAPSLHFLHQDASRRYSANMTRPLQLASSQTILREQAESIKILPVLNRKFRIYAAFSVIRTVLYCGRCSSHNGTVCRISKCVPPQP